MPQYRYQSRAASGRMQNGVMTAQDAATAASMLRSQNHHVLQLSPALASKSEVSSFLKKLNYSSGPTQKDILDFTTQLAVMIRAGISIRNALDGISDQVQNQNFKKTLVQIKMDIEAGKQFSEAIARHPKLFGPLYVNMVRASEMSGSFSRMLDRIAAYLAQ
jgi:type II secretory pathway component PulF